MSNAGRPAKFDTVEDLQNKIDEYFELKPMPTITGLALFLGFESRQSIYDYEKDGEFSYTIKRARLTIEAWYEQNLLGKGVIGAIFALKNFGWADKVEAINTNVNYNVEPTPEEARKIKESFDNKI